MLDESAGLIPYYSFNHSLAGFGEWEEAKYDKSSQGDTSHART